MSATQTTRDGNFVPGGSVGVIEQLDLTTKHPQTVAILDGSGNQITTFGGGTQYTDGDAATAHPIGTGIIFNNGGTYAFTSAANPLPVSVGAISPGTGALNLGKAEDAVHTSGDVGVLSLSVRLDSPASTAGTSGDYAGVVTDANGTVYVNNAYKLDSTNDSVSAVQSGTWTVQPGNTANSTAWLVDTELPAAATLADATTNPTTPVIGAMLESYNGSTWDRIRSGVNADGTNSTGKIATGNFNWNGASWDLTRGSVNGTNSVGTGIMAVGNLAQFDDVSPTSITENSFGNLRISQNRNLYGTLRDAGGNERGANVTANNSLQVSQQAATATLSNVAASATSVTLLSSNTARIGATITNDSSSVVYIKFGTTASTTSYTVVLAGAASAPFSYYEVPAGYNGRIDGIWASATGNARITELT